MKTLPFLSDYVVCDLCGVVFDIGIANKSRLPVHTWKEICNGCLKELIK